MNIRRGLRSPIIRPGIVILFIFAACGFAVIKSGAWSLVYNPISQLTNRADPMEVVNAFHSASNMGDANALQALFSREASLNDNGHMIRGRNEIRDWMLSRRMAGVHLELIHADEKQGQVTWIDLARSEPQQTVSLLRWTAIIQDGKIHGLTVSALGTPDGK